MERRKRERRRFRRMGGGYIMGAFEDEATAVKGFKLQPAFDDQVVAAFGLLPQLAGPVAVLQQLRLQFGE